MTTTGGSGKGGPTSGDPRRGAKRGAQGAAKGGAKGAAKGGAKGGAKAAATGRAGSDAKRSGAKPSAAREEQDPAAQLAAPLTRVLARLPATQRRVLELRMGLTDGHPHDAPDAARILGISLGELREIEARAFERIREVIPLQQLQRFLDR
jgi:DNA-directed RNA polymerase specialized sigma24 family protein